MRTLVALLMAVLLPLSSVPATALAETGEAMGEASVGAAAEANAVATTETTTTTTSDTTEEVVAEPGSPAEAKDLGTLVKETAAKIRESVGSNDARPLVTELYTMLARVDVADAPEGDTRDADAWAAALSGAKSTDAGVTRAFTLVATELGIEAEEVRSADGSARVRVRLQAGDAWLLVDAAAASRERMASADGSVSARWLLFEETLEGTNESAEVADPAQATNPAKEAEPETSDPAQEAVPEKKVEPEENAEQTSSEKAAEPEKKAESEKKADPAQAAEPEKKAESEKKADSAKGVDPMKAPAAAGDDALRPESDDGKANSKATASKPRVAYQTHVQNVGWQGWRRDGDMSGTSGHSLRLEGIEIKLENAPVSGGIQYRTHVQNVGWQGWRTNGAMSGTSYRALRLEAIEIKLTGEMAKRYDVYYRVHAQNVGWMGWAKNGGRSGTACHAWRLEGIQIVLVAKGSSVPGATLKGIRQATGQAYVTRLVQYRTHVQNDGWQGYAYDGAMSGTSGRSLRLEGMNVSLPDAPCSGGIQYRTHVQNIGWQGWAANGGMSGTSGRSLRLEAMQVKLTGEMANRYDVWYHVHAQNFGWMGWTKNGGSAGTEGYAYRLEGMEIKILPKGSVAPGGTANAFRKFDQRAAARANAVARGLQVFEGTVKILNGYQLSALDKDPNYNIYGKQVPSALDNGNMGKDFNPSKSRYAVLMLDRRQNITGKQDVSTVTHSCRYIVLGRYSVWNKYASGNSTSAWNGYNGKRVCVAGKVWYLSGLDLGMTAQLKNEYGKNASVLY